MESYSSRNNMPYFAKVNQDNVVIEVVNVLSEFVESGGLGDTSGWVECSHDESFRGIYPAEGDVYDPIRDQFHPPKPEYTVNLSNGVRTDVLPSFVFRKGPEGNWNWFPPTDNPGFLLKEPWCWKFKWEESSLSWVEISDPSEYEVEKYIPAHIFEKLPQKVINPETREFIDNPHYGKSVEFYKNI